MSAEPAAPAAPRASESGPVQSFESVAPKSRRSRRRVALYLSPGQKIADRYEILQVLGEGGMGVVYSCRDESGELCAVKRVVLSESNAAEHLGWFVAEAEALAALNHPSIVRARDFGQLRDGTPYLVMDLVDGVLWQQLAVERTDFLLVWTLVDQVLGALAHAHARGIVHGDLKPANVVVDVDAEGEPRARLFDFGLAKRRRFALDPRLGQRASPSQPPSSAGTPGYMAPEQLLGRSAEISAATDLYALGCILYRTLTGRALPQGERGKLVDFRSFAPPPRPDPLPGVSERLVDLVLALLELEPWRRPSSAAEVRAEWQTLRPSGRLEPGALVASRLARGDASANLESTLRIGPEPPRAGARLGRSSRWLPGLLGVRACPLVGRAEQCRMLLELAERVCAEGEPPQRAVVITGVAGVGKTRLAEWLSTELEERGRAVVLRGTAEGAPGREPLARSLAGLFEREAGGGGLGLDSLRCVSDDLEAVRKWVRGRPLLLFLDELAHCGSETLAFVAGLARFAPELRCLLLTTARSGCLGEPGCAHALRTLKALLPTDLLRLQPLDSLTTSALLRAAHPIDPALALQIALASAGVPLAALSRLYAAARRGRI